MNIIEEVGNIRYHIERALDNQAFTLAFEKDGKKQYVLSKYQPKEHALSMLGQDFGNKQTIWIIFGFGFGYMLKEIIDRVGEHAKVIIVEPNSQLLREQIEVFQNKELLERDNISIFSGESFEQLSEKLGLVITDIDFNNVKIKSIKGYLEYYHGYYKKVVALIEEHVIAREINFNTIACMNEAYIRNIVQNRYAILEGCNLTKHANKYTNTPALIVSAGPSLKKNIEQVKDFKGIIFVIGRTMTPILEQGIRPDFVVSVDPLDVISETFNKYKKHDIPLITMSESNWRVVSGSKGPKYFIHNSAALTGLLGTRINPGLALSGSVATLCLSTAEYMGCNPVVFIGQDLAYTNNEKHSQLAVFKDDWMKENRVDPENGELRFIKSYDQKTIESSDVLISFLRWIENFIKEHNETTYINATEGGAYIEGALHIPLKQAIEEYCYSDKPEIIHETLIRDKDLDIDKNLNDAIEVLKKIYQETGRAKICYDELLKEYRGNRLQRKYRIQELVTEIQDIDKILIEINEPRDIIQMIMEKISLAIRSSNTSKQPIEESEEELSIRKIRLNYETYEALESESKRVIELIEKELE